MAKPHSPPAREGLALRHLVDIPTTRQSLLFEVDVATILKHVFSIPFLCAMVSLALAAKGDTEFFLEALPTTETLAKLSLEDIPPKLGYGAAAAISVMTLSGVHIVWTHVWAALTLFAIVSRDELLIGGMTVLGTAITISWYSMLAAFTWGTDPVGKAVHGWAQWIIIDLCGCEKCPFDETSVPLMLRLGFHLVDLSVRIISNHSLVPMTPN